MSDSFNDVFISVLKKQIVDNKDLVKFLSDYLHLGRESVYRRLRGDIPFTTEEVVKICAKLGLSIDNIANVVNMSPTQNAIFNLALNLDSNPYGFYTKKLNVLLDFLIDLGKAKQSKRMIAASRIPYSFVMDKPHLIKFVYYKWFHQTENIPHSFRYEDFDIPVELIEVSEKITDASKKIGTSIVILDKKIFKNIISDIEYFYQRNLFDINYLNLIRGELYEVIDSLENQANDGGARAGHNVEIYLSPVSINGLYTYYEYDEKVRTEIWLYMVESVSTSNQQACKLQKDWMDSLKRYSTLISKSGEMQRFQYFNLQREHIKSMGNT